MSIGDFPESLTQAMLVGVMLVGGLEVSSSARIGSEGGVESIGVLVRPVFKGSIRRNGPSP